ncbi:MAG: hypothetical protein IJ668_07345 [Selenomonadaceae bacterium]|nr:hypothetical protein [Selenomonadaceae bacterium]
MDEHETLTARRLNKAREEVQELRGRLKGMLSKIDQRSKKLMSEIEGLRAENRRLEQEKSSLQGTLKRVREQSAQRFERGWELFQRYQEVGAHARQILQTGVFAHEDDFTSFICGGAQPKSLATLWDVTNECMRSGRREDAEILWDIFEYCVELVNSTKEKDIYAILQVDEGDQFDSDFQTEGPRSRAQGKVIEVYLRGYRNNYNGDVIRKSVVRVG